jgi:hypothetical protein
MQQLGFQVSLAAPVPIARASSYLSFFFPLATAPADFFSLPPFFFVSQ